MAYDEELAARVRDVLAGEPGIATTGDVIVGGPPIDDVIVGGPPIDRRQG